MLRPEIISLLEFKSLFRHKSLGKLELFSKETQMEHHSIKPLSKHFYIIHPLCSIYVRTTLAKRAPSPIIYIHPLPFLYAQSQN